MASDINFSVISIYNVFLANTLIVRIEYMYSEFRLGSSFVAIRSFFIIHFGRGWSSFFRRDPLSHLICKVRQNTREKCDT